MKHLATRRTYGCAKSRLKVRCYSAEISLKARESVSQLVCEYIMCILFLAKMLCAVLG